MSDPIGDNPHTNATSGPVSDVLATFYTAPCRRCGRRLHLSEEELVSSMTTPPACWHCDGSPSAAPAS